MIDLLFTTIFLSFLILALLELTDRYTGIMQYIKKLIKSESGQHFLTSDFVSFLITSVKDNWKTLLVILFILAIAYDNITSCYDDPLGIRDCGSDYYDRPSGLFRG